MIAGVQAGDSEAVHMLVVSYRAQLFGYLFRSLGNRDDALDLTQEVLFRVCQKAHRYDGAYPLTPWIYRIASNLCTDHFRKKNFRLHRNSVALDEAAVDRRSDDTPEKVTMRREMISRVRKAVKKLPPRQRQVLEMRLLGEYRLREIAEAQGISVGTVKSTLHYALARLRKHLSDLA